jgi:hypothetical protein
MTSPYPAAGAVGREPALEGQVPAGMGAERRPVLEDRCLQPRAVEGTVPTGHSPLVFMEYL